MWLEPPLEDQLKRGNELNKNRKTVAIKHLKEVGEGGIGGFMTGETEHKQGIRKETEKLANTSRNGPCFIWVVICIIYTMDPVNQLWILLVLF